MSITAGTWPRGVVVVVEAVGTVVRGCPCPGEEQAATTTHAAPRSAVHRLPPVARDPSLVTVFHVCPCETGRQGRAQRPMSRGSCGSRNGATLPRPAAAGAGATVSREGHERGFDRRPPALTTFAQRDGRARRARGGAIMGALDGRVAIITGAGRGIGREHALLFAAEGAKVVVNDLGGAMDGTGDDRSHAQQVADEIKAMGGEAVANADNVADWEGGQRLVNAAIEAFGDLHVLVNNAGILRDRVLVNMTEEEWDSVIHVHLKGHFVPTRWAAAFWREQSKAGKEVRAAVVNTSSTSGLLGNPGQANYGAAKAGIGALTVIAAQELVRYGVRVNGIAPAARTRLTEATPGLGDIVKAPEDGARFDEWDPANISPLVAYLAMESCPLRGRMFFIQGGKVSLMTGWAMGETMERDDRWTVRELEEEMAKLVRAG